MGRKTVFEKPGNFIYPVPAVMVSCRNSEGQKNIITIAWTGTICSDPPMAYISVRKERFSYEMIRETGEFVINLPDRKLARALDYCGCVSGSRTDKFAEMHLTPGGCSGISAPSIEEAPVSIGCRVKQIIPLGTHDMFLAEVVSVQVDAQYIDEKGAFHMEDADLLAYSHGRYYTLGDMVGTFGYAVRRKPDRKKPEPGKADRKKPEQGKTDMRRGK